MPSVKVIFYAPYNIIAGVPETTLEIEQGLLTKADLRKLLFERFPNLAKWCGSGRGGTLEDFLILTVDAKLTPENEMVKPGSTVGVFYPLGGG